ncbi:DUF6544 family protein [Nocardioides marmoribigeumensis]|uniref:Uncharacterized protein n=1 Tax=Nocardioides marmoribigeumensis TaxID=433649 RepID=A0ABU2BQ03_9ACTN|nr:DUF6544 family protein [Nocardioides marmoribigeumensis]MDR7360710.1 hypothetical protein [Nocardioides marmoribigeumensis]
MTTAVRWTVVLLLTVHGLIHLLGVVKGFGWAEVPALTQDVSPAAAVLWSAATVLVLATAATVALGGPDWRWVLAGAAAVVSEVAIVSSWADAKAGTAANLVLVLVSAYGFASLGPGSQAAQFDRQAHVALSRTPHTAGVVTEADLARLPEPVATYVRRSGAVGRPRVTSLHADVHGRIRSGPDDAWMPFHGEQVNTFGEVPQRVFHIDATMRGLPVSVLHVFDEHAATMRAELLDVVPVVRARGPEMDRSETVTIFNDLLVLAPAALVDAPVAWEVLDARHVRGTLTAHGHRVSADLTFDEAGDLVDFVSRDRSRASSDGQSFLDQPWSTPLQHYADLHGRRLAVEGQGVWDAPAPEGRFAYIDFVVDDLTYNPS